MKNILFLLLMVCLSIIGTAQKGHKNQNPNLKRKVFETAVIESDSIRNTSGSLAKLADFNTYPSTSDSGHFSAQKQKISKTRFILGLSIPELLHAGITYRIANISQIGFSAGLGPTLGGVWPAISIEHRLYFGKNSEKTNQKTWFCRQGSTFFTSADPPEQFTFNLTVGKDIIFKNNKGGVTIGAGVFYLPVSDNSAWEPTILPAIRFDFFFFL